jgi:hypothetical protein
VNDRALGWPCLGDAADSHGCLCPAVRGATMEAPFRTVKRNSPQWFRVISIESASGGRAAQTSCALPAVTVA